MYHNGYEPKCKLCNSKLQDKIENMRKENQTYEDIKVFMMNKGEETSLMSISRHFKKHYPVKKAYVEEKNLKKQKELEDNKKVIQETIRSFPYLEDTFKKEINWESGYQNDLKKNKPEECLPKTFKDVFLDDCGYCTSGYRFCENVPKKQVYCVSDALANLDMQLPQIGDKSTSSTNLKLLEKKTECANCIAFYNDCFNEFIIYSMIRKMFSREIELEEFKRVFIDDLECDNQKAYDYLFA